MYNIMTDAETLLAKIKQQNRIRQQEYYKRHKDAVNEKRRYREKLKEMKK